MQRLTDTDTVDINVRLPRDLHDWLADEAAVKNPRPNGGGYVARLVRDLLAERKRRSEAARK